MTPPVAASVPQTPPTVPEPSTAAPVAVPQATQPVAPKPVIRVPLDIAPAETAPRAESRPACRSARPARRAHGAACTTCCRGPGCGCAGDAPVTEAPLLDEAAPIATPATAAVEPVAEAAAPLPTEKANTGGNGFHGNSPEALPRC